jgi:hypothetical protein
MGPFRSTRFPLYWNHRPWPQPKTKLIPGLLTVLLLATSATPAFAGRPSHGHQAGRHEHQHELSVTKKHHGKSKIRTITKSFSNGGAIAIPAEDAKNGFGPADPYPSSIDVSGFKPGTITDLNLTLHGFSHTFPEDVDVLLVAPDGRNAVVMGDVGGQCRCIRFDAHARRRGDHPASR